MRRLQHCLRRRFVPVLLMCSVQHRGSASPSGDSGALHTLLSLPTVHLPHSPRSVGMLADRLSCKPEPRRRRRPVGMQNYHETFMLSLIGCGMLKALGKKDTTVG
ncbi:hypothetical protein ZHAS_00015781 [Anopheles sinensis]|uniref:Uncharacterized protein n=1 Tax=Anopheles sinensis TaxID=74873 RepID=A0A084WBX2_ANOSI|nr:hypothetical protein ZHAS_00015781 [Anopheles sinensis]